MWPLCCRSAELSSLGTRPTNALARAASPPKRAGASITAWNVRATTGPTPGAVISRCASGSCVARVSTASSAVVSVVVSCCSTSRSGARTRRDAGGTVS